jgi:hypothetical protein
MISLCQLLSYRTGRSIENISKGLGGNLWTYFYLSFRNLKATFREYLWHMCIDGDSRKGEWPLKEGEN